MKLYLSLLIIAILFVSSQVFAQTAQDWNKKGIEFYGKQEYEEALKCFDKALQLDPTSPDLWFNRGNTYFWLFNNEKASGSYGEVLKLKPSHTKARFLKAYILNFLGKNSDAKACLEEVFIYDGDLKNIRLNETIGTILITPLNIAVKAGSKSVVDLLVSKGADVNFVKSTRGGSTETPLHTAVGCKNKDLVKYLISCGADMNITADEGMVPLAHACYDGPVEIVKILIESGANLEAKDMWGMTPLYWACRKGDKTIIELLIKSGANINARDNGNQTPLSFAEKEGKHEVIELLKKYGAKK